MARQERRPHKRFIAIGVACLMLFTPSVSLAWGPEAHKVMAYIAFDELTSTAKRRISELLLPPKSKLTALEQAFVDASTWADDIRVTRPEFNAEHFIDKPFPKDGAPLEPNLLTALNKNLAILRDTTKPRTARVEALKFIIHYVGDIHQPLHCATRTSSQYPNGDAGGNRFQIMVTDSGGKLRTISLHSYWDRGLDSFSLSTFTVRKAASAAEKAYSGPKASSFNLEDKLGESDKIFQGWADESFKLAKEVAYVDVEDGSRVSVSYRSKGIKTTNEQLVKAAYRLSALLSAVWD